MAAHSTLKRLKGTKEKLKQEEEEKEEEEIFVGLGEGKKEDFKNSRFKA